MENWVYFPLFWEVTNALVNPHSKGIYETNEVPDVIAAMLEATADDVNK